MASSVSSAPSTALSAPATSKTPTARRRAKADERLAAIADILENVKGAETALAFVNAVMAVWVRVLVCLGGATDHFLLTTILCRETAC